MEDFEIQFEDVQKQEGKERYNKILVLEEIESIKIKAITVAWKEEHKPSERYLNQIKKGIK